MRRPPTVHVYQSGMLTLFSYLFTAGTVCNDLGNASSYILNKARYFQYLLWKEWKDAREQQQAVVKWQQ